LIVRIFLIYSVVCTKTVLRIKVLYHTVILLVQTTVTEGNCIITCKGCSCLGFAILVLVVTYCTGAGLEGP